MHYICIASSLHFYESYLDVALKKNRVWIESRLGSGASALCIQTRCFFREELGLETGPTCVEFWLFRPLEEQFTNRKELKPSEMSCFVGKGIRADWQLWQEALFVPT